MSSILKSVVAVGTLLFCFMSWASNDNDEVYTDEQFYHEPSLNDELDRHDAENEDEMDNDQYIHGDSVDQEPAGEPKDVDVDLDIEPSSAQEEAQYDLEVNKDNHFSEDSPQVKISISAKEQGTKKKVEQSKPATAKVEKPKVQEAAAVQVTKKPSDRILAVQKALAKQGFKIKVDGFLGKQTSQAISEFQKKTGLTATGTLDTATAKRLGV